MGINLSSLSKMTSGKVNFDSYWLFIDVYLSADLRKGSLRHSSNYYIIDILKTHEMTKKIICFLDISTKMFLSLDVIKVANISEYI